MTERKDMLGLLSDLRAQVENVLQEAGFRVWDIGPMTVARVEGGRSHEYALTIDFMGTNVPKDTAPELRLVG